MKITKTILIILLVIILSACNPPQTASVTESPTATLAETFTETPPAPLTATVNETQGSVEARQPEQADFGPASNGMRLAVSGQVRTGEQSAARLDLSSGTLVRIGQLTIFTLRQLDPQPAGLLTRLQLLLGELWILLNGGTLEVEMPGGAATVRGSYMGVQVDPSSGQARVTCLEGLCDVRTVNEVASLLAGQAANLPADGEGRILIGEMTPNEVQRWLEVNPEATPIIPALTATVGAWRTLTPAATLQVNHVLLPALSCLSTRTCTAYCARLPIPSDCRAFNASLDAQNVNRAAFWDCLARTGEAQECADQSR